MQVRLWVVTVSLVEKEYEFKSLLLHDIEKVQSVESRRYVKEDQRKDRKALSENRPNGVK
ncbi:16275_t:CDS:2 [Dentiscutata heterogama]|uniref:16275_t:CDS:1 n=1 Tax=Dentiscutata heterogama TaxID=1316150 RepID=A0ACA9KV95_9GLOM|nr:16275_t:CDS:2 [Dentiscutata heterogama]